MSRTKNKRLTIGLFVSGFEGLYTNLMCRGASDAAEENDVNLVIFPGRSIEPQFHFQDIFKYEYQFNVAYSYASIENLDALVLSSGTLSSFISKEEFDKFCARYKPMPMVSIAVPLEGISSITINNKYGLKQGLNHIIREHGRKRIAFIKGPKKSIEAEERYSVYLEVLKENGLDFDPQLICPGDFVNYSGVNAVKLLVDKRKVQFDAVFAANDEMALAAMKELQRRNISVPEDVSIAGFDNYAVSAYSKPALTTVRQPIYEQAKRAVCMALDLIKGNAVDDIELDTELVIRESCGCSLKNLILQDKNELPNSTLTCTDSNLKVIIDKFKQKNFTELDHSFLNFEYFKDFVANCFREILGGNFDDESARTLLRSFEQSVNSGNMIENCIIQIQKIVLNLEKEICALLGNKAELEKIQEYFKALHILVVNIITSYYSSRIESRQNEILNLRHLLKSMIANVHSKDEQFNSIVSGLTLSGVHSCFIYLYEKEIENSRNDNWISPETLYLTMAFTNNKVLKLDEIERKTHWKKVINNRFLPQNRRYTMVLSPLYFMEEQIGVILCELNQKDYYLFESLVVEISCALKLSLFISARQKIEGQLKNALSDLEKYNQRLSALSQTDELTSLYNRRGFFNLARHSLELAREMKRNGMLIFADMDGLKKINDTYGHDEGDLAIKAMAETLKKVFRESDIIARMGGDEFTIFAVGMHGDSVKNIQSRLNKCLDEYNLRSRKPYKISISIGAVQFSYKESVTIDGLISQADSLLYNQKRLRIAGL